MCEEKCKQALAEKDTLKFEQWETCLERLEGDWRFIVSDHDTAK